MTPDPSTVVALAGVSAHRVRLSGDIDVAASPLFDAVLQQFEWSEAKDIDVDLAGVTFMDSTGLAFLVKLKRACDQREGTVTLVDPSEVAQRILTLVKFDSVFVIEPALAVTS